MSNLLVKILSNQVDWKLNDYQFEDSFTEISRIAKSSEPTKHASFEHYHKLVLQEQDSLNRSLDEADQDRHHILLKNHTYHVCPPEVLFNSTNFTEQKSPQMLGAITSNHALKERTNPTFFDDDLMQSWTPVILVRHPAAVFESWYRAEDLPELSTLGGMSQVFTTYRLSRQIFDWYRTRALQQNQSCTNTVSEPIVLDADDVLNCKDVLESFCQRIGMNPEKLQFEWKRFEPSHPKEYSERHKRFKASIWNSTGLDASKSSGNIDLDDKKKEWLTQFGPDVAYFLDQRTREALQDYKYLMRWRFTA